MLNKLNHPNIIKLFYCFHDKTKLYFALEYCEGGEFSDYLRLQSDLNNQINEFLIYNQM